MRLSEDDAVRVVSRCAPHNQVLRELDFAVCDPGVLIPCQPILVSLQRGDDVRVAVAIDVQGKHVSG